MATDTSSRKRPRVAVTVNKDFMSATVLMRAPQEGDEDITVEEVIQELEQNGVVFGIEEAVIRTAVTNREYSVPISVAAGRKPVRGIDSSFVYHFNTSRDFKPKEDENGHIDYKDINFIQNTEKGDKLATKVPATPGTPGMTVRGKELEGLLGRDFPFKQGVNTEVTDDGLSLLAAASGAIQFHDGKISVMDVITIKGDVDHTVGNIDCLGSVRVTGGVKAGFKLKIDGDLEVNGNVEDADIRVKGDIIIKGGCFGEHEGILEAGGSITVKYAEGQRLLAGSDITVGGEIVNCRVEAGERVLVKGRRGKIVGGSVRARHRIRAAILGSDAGTATELQVAYDPELVKQHTEVVKEIQRLQEDETRVKETLYVLYRFQMENDLPPEKKAALERLEQFQKEFPDNMNELQGQKAEIEEALAEYREAEIICEESLHPGVRAYFGIIYREIVEEQLRCKLSMEAGKVMISDFRGD